MSTHPVAVERRRIRKRNSRVLIGLLLVALFGLGAFALANLTPDPGSGPDTVAGSTADELHFTSPDKSVTCELTGELARCMVAEAEFPPPAECPALLDVRIDPGLPQGGFTCQDEALPEANQPLAYGDHVTRGELTCRSYVAAIRCSHDITQHGFSVSKTSFITF